MIFFFGCWGSAGHFLWTTNRRQVHNADLPFDYAQLDGGILLPRPEKVGTGGIAYVHGWTILSWWGSPWDRRGAVCNAVLIKGRCNLDQLWNGFQLQFPELISALARPTLIGPDVPIPADCIEVGVLRALADCPPTPEVK